MKRIYPLFAFILITYNSFCQIDTVNGVHKFQWCSSLRNCPAIIIDSTHLWQIGSTNKPFFDTIAYPSAAIMTDTINNYDTNKQSYFTLTFSIPKDYNFMLTFQHKYQTDSLHDGGWIEASYDTGQTWINLAYQQPVEFFQTSNLYSANDTVTGNIPSYNGTQPEWITTQLEWLFIIGERKEVNERIEQTSFPDSLILRFYFKSDSFASQNAGWIIKNFTFYSVDVGGFVPTINNNPFNVHFNNPTGYNLEITANGMNDIEVIDLTGREVLNYKPANSSSVDMNISLLPSGLYFLRVGNKDGNFYSGKFVKQ